MHTLEPAFAQVQSSGRVFLSRPGTLDVMCKFSGLVAFPFDNLDCLVDLGGWMYGADFQGLIALNCTGPSCGPGWSLENTEASSGESYQQYWIQRIASTKKDYYYACCTTPFPVLTYRFTLNRATDYYIRVLIVPQILLTFLAFSVFFTGIDTRLGAGRMSFGMTIVLISNVMGVATSAWLPVCAEVLWIDLFLLNNLAFAYLALIESMLVVLLSGCTTATILPKSIAARIDHLIDRFKNVRGHDVMAKDAKQARFELVSFAAVQFRKELAERGEVGHAEAFHPHERADRTADAPKDSDETLESVAQRIVFYENLFFRVDSDQSGWISRHIVCKMIPFFEMSFDYEQALKYTQAVDVMPSHRRTLLQVGSHHAPAPGRPASPACALP